MRSKSWRTHARDERGGVTTIVALLLAMGVIFGSLTIAIDYGQLMYERSQVQNGADASALSLARTCLQSPTACAPDANSLAAVNNANSSDGRNAFESQCGRNLPASATLVDCSSAGITSSTSEFANCAPVPAQFSAAISAGVPYVEVRTKSDSSANPGAIRNWFARLNGGSATSSVGACARAAWGEFKSGTVMPLTFSYCELEEAIKAVGYGDPKVSPTIGETALALKYKVTGSGTTDPCPALGHTGMDTSGGFGWLDQETCQATVNSNGWVNIDTGKSGPAACLEVGKVFLIPIFDCVSKLQSYCDNISGGAKSWYHVQKFAAFYVTGWVFPSDHAGTPGATASNECKAEANDKKTCLFGMFLKDYVAPAGELAPLSLDPSRPKLIMPIG